MPQIQQGRTILTPCRLVLVIKIPYSKLENEKSISGQSVIKEMESGKNQSLLDWFLIVKENIQMLREFSQTLLKFYYTV